MKALLKNYHQSPRKVRLVADLVRGKSVAEAKASLMYMPKKSAEGVEKLLDSAVANARSMGIATDDLFIKKITVDKGLVMMRARPFARGRSGRIRKAMSIVRLELGSNAVPAKKASRKTTKKAAKSAQ